MGSEVIYNRVCKGKCFRIVCEWEKTKWEKADDCSGVIRNLLLIQVLRFVVSDSVTAQYRVSLNTLVCLFKASNASASLLILQMYMGGGDCLPAGDRMFICSLLYKKQN